MTKKVQKRGVGKRGPNKYKHTPESLAALKESFLEHYERLGSVTAAVDEAGTTYGSVQYWDRTDPLFAFELAFLRKSKTARVRAAVRLAAEGEESYIYNPDGTPKQFLNPDTGKWEYRKERKINLAAAAMWLASQAPEEFCPTIRAKKYAALAPQVYEWWPKDQAEGDGKASHIDLSELETVGQLMAALARQKRDGE